jgi:hypothetical protein
LYSRPKTRVTETPPQIKPTSVYLPWTVSSLSRCCLEIGDAAGSLGCERWVLLRRIRARTIASMFGTVVLSTAVGGLMCRTRQVSLSCRFGLLV